MEKTKAFMKKHLIPDDRIDFSGISPKQKALNEEIFERGTGGSAFSSEKQYALAESGADKWKEWSRGIPGFRYLDIGCGHGYHVYLTREAGLKSSGLNISIIEAELASRGIPDSCSMDMLWQREHHSDIVVGSVTELPYKSESHDGLSCHGVLMMLPHTERLMGGKRNGMEVTECAMEEMNRVLKKGGLLYLVTFSDDFSPSGDSTEDYIFFGKDRSYTTDARGGITDRWDVGIYSLFEKTGFEIRKARNDSGIWKCRLYKK